MKKSKFFVFLLITAFCLVFFGSAFADQEGNVLWCNSDRYGCWIHNEDETQNYIMFWSEEAREFFMGPDSKATVAERYSAGKMPLDPPPVAASVYASEGIVMTEYQKLLEQYADMLLKEFFEPEELTPGLKEEIVSLLEDDVKFALEDDPYYKGMSKEEILKSSTTPSKPTGYGRGLKPETA